MQLLATGLSLLFMYDSGSQRFGSGLIRFTEYIRDKKSGRHGITREEGVLELSQRAKLREENMKKREIRRPSKQFDRFPMMLKFFMQIHF